MARPSVALLLILVLVLSGCMAGSDEPAPAASVAASAADAGAVAGPAPAAADRPYQVATGDGDAAATVHPLPFRTNAAKTPYAQEFTGQFEPQECLPTGGGLPLGGLGLARGGQGFDVTDAFAVGDVFSYNVSMTFTNADSSWAELHLWTQFDNAANYWNEPTSEGRGEIVLNFTGQGYILNDGFLAAVGVDCWYGGVTTPIPFTIKVAVTFAQGAIPAAQPVLVNVPEGATTLYVSGVALDGSRGVTSHYRVFAPDDSLVCECALSSDEPLDALELAAGPGDYVVLVDHTENGFVALGMDAAPVDAARALGSRFERFVIGGSDGGPVDETLQLDLPSTPLGMGAWVFAPGDIEGSPDAGAGHNVRIGVANARGDVLRVTLVGYGTFHAAVPGAFVTNDWYAVPIDGDWEFFQDHHAYGLGAHTVTLKADEMRGVAVVFAQFYERSAP